MENLSILPFLTALLYWGGVVINARRVRKKRGTSPSVAPRTGTDYILWTCWAALILLWAGAPWLSSPGDRFFDSPWAAAIGILLATLGFLGTWWCYRVLGVAWAISVDEEKTTDLIKAGPYRTTRHPIYSFQWLIVLGMFLILPCLPLVIALGILTFAMVFKASIEERMLSTIFGTAYEDYMQKTGRFFPRLFPPTKDQQTTHSSNSHS